MHKIPVQLEVITITPAQDLLDHYHLTSTEYYALTSHARARLAWLWAQAPEHIKHPHPIK